MKLMREQLEKDPIKIPYPLRNEMMSMLLQAWKTLKSDTKIEFKSLFVITRDRRVRRLSCVG